MWDFSSLQREKSLHVGKIKTEHLKTYTNNYNNKCVFRPAVHGYRIHFKWQTVRRRPDCRICRPWKRETVTRQLNCCIKRTSDQPSHLFDGFVFMYTSNKARGLVTGTHRLSKEALLSFSYTRTRNILNSSWCWQRRCSASVRKSEMDIRRKALWGIWFSAEPQVAAAHSKIKIFKSSTKFFKIANPSKCFYTHQGLEDDLSLYPLN